MRAKSLPQCPPCLCVGSLSLRVSAPPRVPVPLRNRAAVARDPCFPRTVERESGDPEAMYLRVRAIPACRSGPRTAISESRQTDFPCRRLHPGAFGCRRNGQRVAAHGCAGLAGQRRGAARTASHGQKKPRRAWQAQSRILRAGRHGGEAGGRGGSGKRLRRIGGIVRDAARRLLGTGHGTDIFLPGGAGSAQGFHGSSMPGDKNTIRLKTTRRSRRTSSITSAHGHIGRPLSAKAAPFTSTAKGH